MSIHGVISQFSASVQGELNATAIGFLQSIAKSNAKGLQKVITKLQQLQISLHAEHVHSVIQALTEEMNLPIDCYNDIKVFLQDPKRKNLINTLQVLSKDDDSRLVHSVLCVMNNLNIFPETTPEEQLLRLVLTLMMQWHIDGNQQRTSKDAARWLKTILGIPRKSSMSQIIQLFGDHLFLSTKTISSDYRTMDCLELLMLFETLASENSMPIVSPINKKIMNDLHAAILTMTICNHSPYAFYDVVARHEAHPHFAMAPLQIDESSDSPLARFFKNASGFTSYFKARKQNHIANQQTFLWSLISTIDSLFSSQEIEAIRSVLTLEKQSFLAFDLSLFVSWFKLKSLIQILLLQSVYQAMVIQNARYSGRIRAATLQLLNMRVSPRSAFTSTNGTFQPLVNTDMTVLNVANTHSLLTFLIQTPSEERTLLFQEIIALTGLYRRTLVSPQHVDHALVPKSDALQLFQPFNALQVPSNKTIPQIMRVNPQQHSKLFYRHPRQETQKSTPGLQDRHEVLGDASLRSEPRRRNNELN